MGIVRVRAGVQCATFWEGQYLVLAEDAPWDDDHPFVVANPDWFTRDQSSSDRVSDRPLAVAVGDDAPVETATAVPGAKRPGKLRKG